MRWLNICSPSVKAFVWCLVVVSGGFFTACKNFTVPKPITNSLTYFNTYYNAQRLMTQAEDKFYYHDEKHRTKPRMVMIEESTLPEDKLEDKEVPLFVQSLTISKEKLQPAARDVDSVIIKGSKILARFAESDYVDGTLFLMAKAYFYQSEWFSAQVKCQELIATYPYSEYSPDAHLLLAKALLMQKKFSQADAALSRAVDIAWGQRRYDALSEAFRIQAEIALHNGSIEDALKPYRRAVMQGDDPEQQARWQVEVALILYRKRQFADAIKELDQVYFYKPDVLATFETELYRAAAVGRMKKYPQALGLFDELERNRNYTEWRPYIYAERINLLRALKETAKIDSIFSIADTLKVPEPLAMARYQIGLEKFKIGEYPVATVYFVKAQVTTMPVYTKANKYAGLLNEWQSGVDEAVMKFRAFEQANDAPDSIQSTLRAQKGGIFADSSRIQAAKSLYALGKIHERLGVPDSALIYYRRAAFVAPQTDTSRARYLYAEAAALGFDITPGKFKLSDSAYAYRRKRVDAILEEIAAQYPLTQHGIDARVRLGYTEVSVRDTVAELFASADKFRTTKQYPSALRQYDKLVRFYPESKFAARSLYATGWIYEQELKNRDSAIAYYGKLVERYPTSVYARDVAQSLDAALEQRRKEDSLKILLRQQSEKPQTPTPKPEMLNTPDAHGKISPQQGVQQPAQSANEQNAQIPKSPAEQGTVPTGQGAQGNKSDILPSVSAGATPPKIDSTSTQQLQRRPRR